VTIRIPVEAVHVRMFARALGDDSPEYRDEAEWRITREGSSE
jgi:hypothetical protein